jgi:hypothetical protein
MRSTPLNLDRSSALLEFMVLRGEARRGEVAGRRGGDRLVGKLDATADRKAGVLRVDAIHQDVTFDKTMAAAVDSEINS